MKKAILLFSGVIIFGFNAHAQTMRYFEFITSCGHGKWQDSSFIAATDDPAMIDTMLNYLALPMHQRTKFISGNIDYGSGGFNHNASHTFLWHFVPNEWSLVDFAIEVCDGCPYSDIDSDTAYWVDLIGAYCPWSGFPAREVNIPAGLAKSALEQELTIYPNPVSQILQINLGSTRKAHVILTNALGNTCMTMNLNGTNHTLDLTGLSPGMYFLKFTEGAQTVTRKLLIGRSE